MVTIIMGVSGSGKSFIGTRLAKQWDVPFYDADEFHSDANRQKMENGTSLADADRTDWLQRLAKCVRAWNQEEGAVLACSVLKQSYRRTLSDSYSPEVQFVYLHGSQDLIRKRMRDRDHFFRAELLDSQFETLEEPSNVRSEPSRYDDSALWVSIDQPPEMIVNEIAHRTK